MFLLDTDHLGILQDRVQPEFPRLLERIAQYPATAFYVSIISFHDRIRRVGPGIQTPDTESRGLRQGARIGT